MFKRFIEDPVLSAVISIFLIILGIIGILTLPITQYPDIAPPTVQVRTQFPGANAQTVLRSVITPLEEKINGVEGMTYMESTASNNGSARITVYFDQDHDPDIAAVNVQNRVEQANRLLPQEVKQSGISTKKQQTDALMSLNVYSSNPEYKADFIANYLHINVLPALERIPGVGDARAYSSQTYAMRIWIKPEKLAMYNLEPADVAAAINTQSQEAAAGVLGESNGEAFSYTIRYAGRYDKVKQYENIILKAEGDGRYLRLKDVADIELGKQNYTTAAHSMGYPSVSLSISQTKGSNAREIITEIHKTLDEFKEKLPDGIEIFINRDVKDFLDASIERVLKTLAEAFILVFIVVFIFLQDLRSTLIPAIAVPVSIIGTFFFLKLFGFSINLLTLFALVLAIGIVVDDAIVVVEVVHAELERGAKDVKKATIKAMDEIVGAIISITLVMAAVFVPVAFIPGPSGVFFKQFGLTLMTAILISAVNALTLSPALCALFLKPISEKKNKSVLNRFYSGFNQTFNRMVNRYGQAVQFVLKYKWITPVSIILAGIGIWYIAKEIPSGFVPDEDRGIINMNVELPVGTSVDRTESVNHDLREKIINAKIPGVANISTVSGYSMLSGQGSNFGLGFIKLDDWSERKEKEKSVDVITEKLYEITETVQGADIIFFAPSSVPGFSSSGGFAVNLLDQAGESFDELNKQNRLFVNKLNGYPEIQRAQSSFSTNYPQYRFDIDIPLAMEAGVDINSIFRVLQGFIGGIYTSDFSKFGKQYRVYIQALPEDRKKLEDLNGLYVKTMSDEMTPVTQFVNFERVYGPQSVTRFNMFNSTKITGSVDPDYSSGDAINVIKEVIKEFPDNYSIDFSGITREEEKASGQTFLIFMLVIIFVYFFLSAQYKSFLLPFSILFSVPIGILGAYFFTWILGLEDNIYFQIGLIMLVGLVAKNAILIVEFALQRRRRGATLVDSAIEGAKARLRPILMTSFAFIIGLMPLVLATGVGAVGNKSIGTGSVGGLLVGTVLGIFIIPVLYVFFQWLQEKITGVPFETQDPESTERLE